MSTAHHGQYSDSRARSLHVARDVISNAESKLESRQTTALLVHDSESENLGERQRFSTKMTVSRNEF